MSKTGLTKSPHSLKDNSRGMNEGKGSQSTLLSFFSKAGKKANGTQMAPNTMKDDDLTELNEIPVKRLKRDTDADAQVACGPNVPLSYEPYEGYRPGDLVWAKMETYPWWPALVYHHPVSHKFAQGSGASLKIHVQFFGPPSRAWMKASKLAPFLGKTDKNVKKGGKYYSASNNWTAALEDAHNAQSVSHEERLKLGICDALSDDDSKENGENGSLQATPKRKRKREKQANRSSTSGADPMDVDTNATEEGGGEDEDTITETDEESEFELEENVNDVSSSETDVGTDQDASDEESPIPAKARTKAKQHLQARSSEKSASARQTAGSASLNSSFQFAATSTPRSNVAREVDNRTKSFLNSFSFQETSVSKAVADGVRYKHLDFDFLSDANRRDLTGKRMSDPGFDPTTLLLPRDFLSKQTPGHRQWWEIKQHHYDTILFFKVGKFYELYHMDAMIALVELNLTNVKGEIAHCGFPEIAYGRMSDQLVQKGYKVARIEQTETPEMLKARASLGTPKTSKRKQDDQSQASTKVVRRELCRITTPATRTFSYLDGELSQALAVYLMAICERTVRTGVIEYGVCSVDTASGNFLIGQFEDDAQGSCLRTFVANYPPAELLFARGRMSSQTQSVVQTCMASIPKQALSVDTQFLTTKATLQQLATGGYFDMHGSAEDGTEIVWPDVLKAMLNEPITMLESKPQFTLCLSALGACVWYLKQCLIDNDLLSMRNFRLYTPDEQSGRECVDLSSPFTAKCMVLDGITLQNLDIIRPPTHADGATGTLLERLDFCSTPFGKRLLHQWMCCPLCTPAEIRQRQLAVQELLTRFDLRQEAEELLTQMPDLERMLQKIHTLGSKARSESHPDSRAIMYEGDTYSKRKIMELLNTLKGFKCAVKLASLFATDDTKSQLLRCCMIDGFPLLESILKHFDDAFDHKEAAESGSMNPARGWDAEYDACCDRIASLESKAQDYLKQQRQLFRSEKVQYFGTGRHRFQLEVPENCTKLATDDHHLRSQRKGFKRYGTTITDQLLADTMTAESDMEATQADIARRFFADFDSKYNLWRKAIECVAVVDVLCSMAKYAATSECNMCCPNVVLPELGQQPFVEIVNGYHPCMNKVFTAGDFIPNDTYVGKKSEDGVWNGHSMLLVTGPNMGGKSTLMRQISLIVVLAQMGSFVPAERCTLTPVDRLFTRLGASDRLTAGQSTFYVELSECSAILKYATAHSLVILDELGRGTATHDGTAIAYAVVKHLAERVGCRTLFSTHYHSLVESFAGHAQVALGHMACQAENDNADLDPSEETVTFLYKFAPGSCPKSYGFYAAKLAGMPMQIVRKACEKSAQFESALRRTDLFHHFMNAEGEAALLEAAVGLHGLKF